MAKQLMDHLESSTERDEGFFVDLFVRESNTNAINMYKKVMCCLHMTINSSPGWERCAPQV